MFQNSEYAFTQHIQNAHFIDYDNLQFATLKFMVFGFQYTAQGANFIVAKNL